MSPAPTERQEKGQGMNMAFRRDGMLLYDRIASIIETNYLLERVVRAIEAGDSTIAAIAKRIDLSPTVVGYQIRVLKLNLSAPRSQSEQPGSGVASYGSIFSNALFELFKEADQNASAKQEE